MRRGVNGIEPIQLAWEKAWEKGTGWFLEVVESSRCSVQAVTILEQFQSFQSFNRSAPFKSLQMKAGSREGDSAGRFHVSAIPETWK